MCISNDPADPDIQENLKCRNSSQFKTGFYTFSSQFQSIGAYGFGVFPLELKCHGGISGTIGTL